jgi:hypothetical protein
MLGVLEQATALWAVAVSATCFTAMTVLAADRAEAVVGRLAGSGWLCGVGVVQLFCLVGDLLRLRL